MKTWPMLVCLLLLISAQAFAADIRVLEKNRTGITLLDYSFPASSSGIGWEADIGCDIRFVQYKNLFLGFDGTIRVVIQSPPLGVDYKTINFNLVPLLGYEIGRSVISLQYYHWSEHYYHQGNLPYNIMNINAVSLAYAYESEKDKVHLRIADAAAFNNYPLTWLSEAEWAHRVPYRLEPKLKIMILRLGGKTLGNFDLGFNFYPAKKIALMAGYKFGDEPMILLAPRGPYVGISFGW